MYVNMEPLTDIAHSSRYTCIKQSSHDYYSQSSVVLLKTRGGVGWGEKHRAHWKIKQRRNGNSSWGAAAILNVGLMLSMDVIIITPHVNTAQQPMRLLLTTFHSSVLGCERVCVRESVMGCLIKSCPLESSTLDS